MAAPAVPLVIAGTGLYLAWFGVHYWRDQTTRWPYQPLASALQGKGLPAPSRPASAVSELASISSAQQAALESSLQAGNPAGAGLGGLPAPPSITVPSGASMATYEALGAKLGPNGTSGENQSLGKAIMGARYPAWTTADWECLVAGWDDESGWQTMAANQTLPGGTPNYNGPYGIPQANPGTKMASQASDWKTNPATQMIWGLDYIASTYGRPSTVPGWTTTGTAPGYLGY
jgi:hypothetical protein